jgi:hypothetical protein
LYYLILEFRMAKEKGMRFHIVLMLICSTLISYPAYAGGNRAVRIVAPEPEQTVHDNSGNLTVTVAVSPPLSAEAGDTLTLLLDNKIAAKGSGLRFELKGIDRGSHTLQAQVNAADGTVIASSPHVIFHMWRASRLFPNRHELK